MIFHPHYCFVCLYSWIAKARLEKCPKCQSTKVINWAGETLWEQEKNELSNIPKKEKS